MKLRWTIRDGKKVLQYEQLVASRHDSEKIWQDVPEIEEPKEPEYVVGWWMPEGPFNKEQGYFGPFKASDSAVRMVDERLIEPLVAALQDYRERTGRLHSLQELSDESFNLIKTYRKHVGKEGER